MHRTDRSISRQWRQRFCRSDTVGAGECHHSSCGKKYLADRLAEAKNKGDVELFFVEAALLIESGYEHIVDEMWYIYAREDVRRRRLSESRGYTPEKIEKIIASQLSEEEFRQHCDFVIDNSDSLEDSYRQIRQKLEAYSWKE